MKAMVTVILAAALAAAAGMVKVDCGTCGGAGRIEGSKTVQVSCENCGGSGKVKAGPDSSLAARKADRQLGSGFRSCFKCRGKGTVSKDVPLGECSACAGSGKVRLFSRYF